MNVNPGELNKKIAVVLFEKKSDESGFTTEKIPKTICTPWAKVTRMSIKEILVQGREINVARCRFLIRFPKREISREMSVLYKGVYYHIEYVNNYGDSNEYLEIMADAGGWEDGSF